MFRIEINTDNAAFAEDSNAELIRQLKEIIQRLKEERALPYVQYDSNGNRVGIAHFTKD